MDPLNVVFWGLFAAVAAFIAWSFLRMFFEILRDSRQPRELKRPPGPANAGVLGGAAAGGISAGDAATPMSGSDYGSSITSGDVASGDATPGDSSGADSGGGDFSGGGGEYG